MCCTPDNINVALNQIPVSVWTRVFYIYRLWVYGIWKKKETFIRTQYIWKYDLLNVKCCTPDKHGFLYSMTSHRFVLQNKFSKLYFFKTTDMCAHDSLWKLHLSTIDFAQYAFIWFKKFFAVALQTQRHVCSRVNCCNTFENIH